jgi:DNA-binding PadR family transcriptional regulator
VRAGTNYAVLSLLLERPSYGYEVLVRFRRSFDAGQWAITPQGLYASLDRLERDGLIEPIDTQEAGARKRQPRTPYRVTASGARTLRRFLETPIGADPSRAEFLVRLQCAASKDAAALLGMLELYERACLDELSRISAAGQQQDGDGRPARETLVERLALEDRRLSLQARLTWIGFAREQLRDERGALQRGDGARA